MIQQNDPWATQQQAPVQHIFPGAQPNFVMTRRQISTIIILSIVTFGIYYLYWYCSVQNQIRYRTGMGFGGLGHILATFFSLGIYGIYWHFVITQRLAAAGAVNKGQKYGVLYLVGMAISFVISLATSNATEGVRFSMMALGMVAGMAISFYVMAQIQTDINNIGQPNDPLAPFGAPQQQPQQTPPQSGDFVN